jgi:hypothetical protein
MYNNKRTIFTIILVVLFFFLPLSANIKDYQFVLKSRQLG